MSSAATNASRSRTNHASKVILLNDDEEGVLKPADLTDEDALKRAARGNGLASLNHAAEDGEDAGEELDLIPVEEDIDGSEDDDEDDFEDYLEDILHTLLETEGATEQDAHLPPSEVCTPEETSHYRTLLHTLGANKFIEETVSAGLITPRKLCTAFNVAISPIIDLLSSIDSSSSPSSNSPSNQDQDDTSSSTTNIWYRLLGMAIMRFLLHRQKLPQYNTIDDVVTLLNSRTNILVITGAGISTNLGIPDFRSKNTGFYSKLAAQGIDNPEDIFELSRFKEDPALFFEHAGETFPNVRQYSPTHAFIRLLQDKGKLLTNYTQNIDNLEEVAGISEDRLVQCHGSWASATCLECGHTVRGDEIRDTVTKGEIPYCPACITRLAQPPSQPSGKRKRSPNTSSKPNKRRRPSFASSSSLSSDDNMPTPGVLKPGITFFGESLPTRFFDRFRHHDLALVDMVIVIGTSLKVAPVSEIPLAVGREVPQVYVGREACKHVCFDVTLLGDCDEVVGELVRRGGWGWGGVGEGMVGGGKGREKGGGVEEVRLEVVDEEKAWWSVRKV